LLLWLAANAVAVAAAVLVVSLASRLVMRLLAHRPLVVRFARRVRGPLMLLLASTVTASTVVEAEISDQASDRVTHVALIGTIVACGWLAVRVIAVLVDEWIRVLKVDAADNLRARTAHTQLAVLRRLASVLVGVIVAAAVLWTFDEVRVAGASILASAGLISVVAGIAAQSSLANLFAGLQIAFSAPIRYDDVVVVEGQWGRVEDITLTYVVVRTWDERRLILPCTWFTQHVFENWTRPTSAILAPVELEVDHCVDVDEVRRVVDEVAEGNPRWDGRVKAVQVTGSNPTTMTVRVLLSARDAGTAFELRCEVREAVFAHLRDHRPEALPGVRVHERPLRGAA